MKTKTLFTTFLAFFLTLSMFSQPEYYRGVNPDSFNYSKKSQLSIEGYFTELFSGFHDQPIDLEFHPDGDKMVVAERKGFFWLYKLVDGEYVRNTTRLRDFSNQVTKHFERGVQSILVDTHYIYAGYTVEESYAFPDLNLDVSDNSATFGRISRWEVSWNQNITLSEQIKVDGIPSLASNHNSIAMTWGKDGDGVIYAAIGDSSYANYGEEAVERGIIPSELEDFSGGYRSQIKSTPNGKVLKFLSWNGWGHFQNPYYDPQNKTSWLSRLYSYGTRNPFQIYYDEESDKLMEAGVGGVKNEEITEVIKNGNGGWIKYEGFSENNVNTTIINPDTGQPFLFDYNNPPVMDYGRSGSPLTRLANLEDPFNYFIDEDNPIEGNSITGGVVLKEGFGPYTGYYIFGDYSKGWLNLLSPDRTHTVNFAPEGSFNNVVSITQAPDGSLYVTTLLGGIHRIYYEDTLSNGEVTLDDNSIRFYSQNNYLKIKEEVTIYSITGSKVLTVSESQSLNLPSGFYIVKGSKETKKIVIN